MGCSAGRPTSRSSSSDGELLKTGRILSAFLSSPPPLPLTSSTPGLSPTPPGGRAATRAPSPAPARGVSCAPQGARSVRGRVPLGPGALGSSPLSLRGVGTAVFRFEFFCCRWRLHRSPRVRSGRCRWGARSQFLTSSGDGGQGEGWGCPSLCGRGCERREEHGAATVIWTRGLQGIRAGRAAGEGVGAARAPGWRPCTQE